MLGIRSGPSTIGNGFDHRCSFAGDHKAEGGRLHQATLRAHPHRLVITRVQ